MTNSHSMAIAIDFERKKNTQAGLITLVVCVTIFFLFFMLRWSTPQIVPPPIIEGIEVNLGDADMGSGDVQPLSKGEPSEANNDQSAAAGGAPEQTENTTEDKTDDPEAVNTAATKPVVKPVPNNPSPVKPNPAATATKPTPKPPKPKAVFAGGTSTNSGNNPDIDNGYKNQGNDAAGTKGDKGKPGGDPNSKNYDGNASSGSGVKIRSGLNGRKFAKLPTFQDEFNENAKVAVDITVNAAGNVTQALINQKGTTTTNANILGIAKRKALQLKMTAGTEEQTGTIVFDFKLK